MLVDNLVQEKQEEKRTEIEEVTEKLPSLPSGKFEREEILKNFVNSHYPQKNRQERRKLISQVRQVIKPRPEKTYPYKIRKRESR